MILLNLTSATQVFKLDFANSKRDLPLAGGAVAANERFNRLAWSPLGSETEAHPVSNEQCCGHFSRPTADSHFRFAAGFDRRRPGGRNCEPLEPRQDSGFSAYGGAR